MAWNHSVKRRVLSILAMWFLIPAGAGLRSAQGQEIPNTQPSTQPAQLPVVSLSEQSIASVEAQLRLLDTTSDLPVTARTELRDLYEQTIAYLKKDREWRTLVSQLQEAGQEAPAESARIRTRLKEAQSRPATLSAAEDLEALTSGELSAKLTKAETELDVQEQVLARAENEVEAWMEKKTSLPRSIIEANTRLDQIAQKADQPPAADALPEVIQARQMLHTAQQQCVEQEIRAYEEQLSSSSLLTDLLQARRDEARLRVEDAQARVDALRRITNQRRQADANQRKQEIQERLKNAPAPIREFVEKSSALIDEELQLTSSIDQVSTRSKEVTGLLDKLNRSMRVLRNKVEVTNNAAYLGPLLNQSRKQLPDINEHERYIQWIQQEIPSVQVRLLDLEEERTDFEDLDRHQNELMSILEQADIAMDHDEMAATVAEALNGRVETLDSLRRNYEAYWNDLVAVNIAESGVIAKTQEMNRYIDERILWIRNNPPLHQITMPERFFPQAQVLRRIADSLLQDAQINTLGYLAVVLGLAVWFLPMRKLRALRRRIKDRVARPYTDSFLLTIEAMLIDLHRCLPVPAIMWFLGSRLSHAAPVGNEDAYQIAQGLSLALVNLAAALLVYTFFLRLCRPGGVAEIHFQWDPAVVTRLRKGITFLLVVGVPLIFLANLAQEYPDPAWRSVVGRASYIGLMLLAAVVTHYMLHPVRGVLQSQGKDSGLFGLKVVKVTCYLMPIGVFAVLATASAAGYQLLAAQLGRHVGRTIWLVLGLVLLRSLVIRFVAVSQRRMAIREARERLNASGENSTEGGPSGIRTEEEEARALAHISDQTHTVLRWLTAFGLIFGIWTIWQDVFPAFSFVNKVELWTYTLNIEPTGAAASNAQPTTVVKSVHLADLLFALILAVFTVILATNGPNVIEIVLLARLPIDAGARFAIAALSRYLIIVAGLILSFQVLGIGWSKVQWLAAAITVGLGFGLQEIFANFVSGLIILFERPVRIGDVVTVGSVDGKITRIQMRATTLTDWNRRELIVPNKELITGQIVNWTLSDPVTRVDIPVGVAYGSDTQLARDLLLKAAKASSHVLATPAPVAIFRRFGDSSLDFELRVHIPNRDIWPQMIDELHTRIDNAFREAGIEIAFPQRDIHIRTITDEMPPMRTVRLPSSETLPDAGLAETRPID